MTVKDKNGLKITNLTEKAEALSRRYQVPLGEHPKRDPKRRQMLRERRRILQERHPKGQGHEPVTIAETRVAKDDLSNGKAPGLSRVSKEDLDI